jgi:hypothetical protein
MLSPLKLPSSNYSNNIFLDITPCSSFKVNCCLLHVRPFFALLFNTEDGGDMFLRSTGYLSTHWTTIYPKYRNLNQKYSYYLRKIWGSNSGGYEEFCLLGCNATLPTESQPILRRNIPPPYSGLKDESSKKPAYRSYHLLSRWFISWLIFYPEDGGDIFLRNVGWLCRVTS